MLNMSKRTEAIPPSLLQELFEHNDVEKQREKNMQQTLNNAWQLVVAQRR